MTLNGTEKFHYEKFFNEMNRKAGPYIIYQVGDLCCEPGHRVETHKQTVYEISFIVSGKGSFFVDGQEYRVSEGMLFLNKIGDSHRIRSSREEPLRFFYLGFDFHLNNCNRRTLSLKNFLDNPDNRVLYNANEIPNLFKKLFSELISGDIFAERMLENYIDQILIYAYRCLKQKKHYTYIMKEKDVDKKLVHSIVHYIDTQVENIKNLSCLSDEFGYSYSHISQVFNSYMGENLKSYYRRRRFEKAKENIIKGMSVTEISEKLGYKSIHAFSRAFHHYVGMPPTQYKKWVEENKKDLNG